LKEVLSQRNRLSIAERMFVDYMNEMITGRYDEALHLITELSRLVPRSLGVNHNLAQMAIQLNRPRTAIQAIERLPLTEQHSRHRLGILRQSLLASALHMAGEYDRELEQITLARRHAPADLTFAARGAGALAALGRLDDVVRAVEHSLSVAPTSGNPVLVMELAAEELRAHGRREASLAMAARLVRWLRDRPSNEAATMQHREDLANALYLSEQWEEAGTLFAQLAADDPSRVELLGALGTTAARRGDTERARAVAGQLAGWSDPLHLGAPAFWRACIAALLNDRESAVDRLRESFAELPRSSLRLHRDPDLETLRDYPPYLDLVRLKD
jgi:tetratricopeptide (TPR) repeat protein